MHADAPILADFNCALKNTFRANATQAPRPTDS